MRCAERGPTPGRQVKASISSWTSGACFMANRFRRQRSELETWRQRHAGGELAHAVLLLFLDLAHGIVDRGGEQVLENFLVFLQQRRIDIDAAHIMATIH